MKWKVVQLQMGSVEPTFCQYMDAVYIICLYSSHTDGMDRAHQLLVGLNNWYL